MKLLKLRKLFEGSYDDGYVWDDGYGDAEINQFYKYNPLMQQYLDGLVVTRWDGFYRKTVSGDLYAIVMEISGTRVTSVLYYENSVGNTGLIEKDFSTDDFEYAYEVMDDAFYHISDDRLKMGLDSAEEELEYTRLYESRRNKNRTTSKAYERRHNSGKATSKIYELRQRMINRATAKKAYERRQNKNTATVHERRQKMTNKLYERRGYTKLRKQY